jgi:hypothetical protein
MARQRPGSGSNCGRAVIPSFILGNLLGSEKAMSPIATAAATKD